MSDYQSYLEALGVTAVNGDLDVFSPIDGAKLGSVQQNKAADVDDIAKNAKAAFEEWRTVPAPRRGEFIRILGDELREAKEALGALVTIECGKSLTEGLGEVQEMIDICDFAVGLSRQIDGENFPSERPEHKMRESYHPLGPVGVISAFNFPVAVWCWNAAIAIVAGDSVVWKPSEKTPLTAQACQNIFDKAAQRFTNEQGISVPEHLSQLLIGGRDVGAALVEHPGFPLISATGSTVMGQAVGQSVAARFGKTILELGGNNAIIVAPSADLDMALTGTVFGAVGTAGQRCTSTRRVIIHEDVYDDFVAKMISGYGQLKIGSPLDSANHMGPLIDEDAIQSYEKTIAQAQEEGGKILVGGERIKTDGGHYVLPTIIAMEQQSAAVRHETFAPILYVFKYKTLDQAIDMQNAVPQGLSSAIFTMNMREAEKFTAYAGSDCGIANVNIGTSGAEIGGAFGGEKETGGGRESGSDSWKTYMRRQTQTFNYSDTLPLAQGVKFEL